MDHIRLGDSGLYVSRLALGTIPFGSGGGMEEIAGLDDAAATRQLETALERGVNFVDTANIYNGGDSEKVLGRILGRNREEIVLTSKARAAVGDGPNDSGASRLHLTRAVEDSLRRLDTDHLDLMYLHQWDGQTPIRETIETMAQLIRAGKIRYWGVSNYSGWQLAKTVYEARLAGLPAPIAQQVYYTPEAREIEYEIIPAARDLGVATFGWSPLGEGLLNGKVRRGRPTPSDTRQGTGWPEPHVTDWNRAYDLIELFDEIAQELGWSPAGGDLLDPGSPRGGRHGDRGPAPGASGAGPGGRRAGAAAGGPRSHHPRLPAAGLLPAVAPADERPGPPRTRGGGVPRGAARARLRRIGWRGRGRRLSRPC